jgi:peptidoglycan/LPS O-acetylase OafA/YrhL
MVILCFLFGVNLYTLRNRTPRHFGLFVLSLGMAWIFLLFRQTCYLAALPVAYTTVYAGLLNPPRTRVMLGADYSYGIYLYGFPVQQTIVYLFPGSRLWIINFFGSVLISGFCAFLSWNLLEAKIMSKRKSVLALVGRITMLIIGVKSRVWQRLETGANLPRF